ncbi:MAG: PhoU domain-containing protein [Candidatus Ranarchaeia archaeon]
MTRRTVQSIRGSFYIYLPKSWCRRSAIKKGAELELTESSEGTLIVHPPSVSIQRRWQTTINVDRNGWSSTPVFLVAAYISGYRRVQFRSKTPIPLRWRERLNALTRKLLGFEVIDESDFSLTLEDVTTSYELSSILRREFTSLKYMLHGVQKAIGTHSKIDAEVVINRDDDVDRYRYAVERVSHLAINDTTIRSKIKVSVDSCLNYSISAKYLERMADHSSGIASEILNGHYPPKELETILAKIINAYDAVTKAFFSGKIHTVEPLLGILQNLEDKLQGLQTQKTSNHSRLIFFHLERILSYCIDLAEIAVDLVIGKNVALIEPSDKNNPS